MSGEVVSVFIVYNSVPLDPRLAFVRRARGVVDDVFTRNAKVGSLEARTR